MLISFVIPTYNEEESLAELYRQIAANVASTGHDYEIIFIDDGSTDGSFAVMEELHAKDDRVRVIQFRRNYGKAAALEVGFDQVQGEVVCTPDADLQDDPMEIPRFLEKLDEGYDMVIGWKYPRLDPITKTAPSKLFNATLRASTGLNIHENNSGYKAMRRIVAEEMTLYGEMHRFIPAIAHWRGFKVTEIKVKHHPRKFGKTKYGLARMWRGFFDFTTIYFLNQFTRRPLHFFGSVGLVTFGIGFLIDFILTVQWALGLTVLHTRPLLWLGFLMIIVGIQFLIFGLLAEMITYGRITKQADYSIRQTLD
ncbi:MAG TPA: glycosyltransferase family 2 protein [Anaerolineales bacterium]|nr:glycosyltransferase family 2 protein [Anaerolineales bacterium]